MLHTIFFVNDWATANWVAAGIGAAISLYIIYQTWFHPLARYPGPWMRKISGVRAMYYGLRGDTHLDILWCHQQYGSAVRYKPNMVVWNDVSGLKDIYSSRANVRKTRNYRFTDHGFPNILSTADKKVHAARRRMMSTCFADGAVHQFEPKLLHHAQAFTDCLSGERAQDDKDLDRQAAWGPAMDMSAWSNYLTFDVMTDFLFGKKSNMLSKRKNQALMPIIERLLNVEGMLFNLSLPFPERLNTVLLKLVNQRHDMFSQYIADNAQARRGLSSDQLPKDVFSHLASSRDSHSGRLLNHEELQSDCLILSIAGYDTLSTTLAASLFYLSRYSHALAKLAHELRTVFPSAEEIRASEPLKQCHYLHACLTEALRISPPVTMCLAREVEEGGAMIDGQFIPPGCVVGASIYAVHRNAEYFPHPGVFLPERWLTASGHYSGPNENKGSPAAMAFNPFSIGPRACIGKTLALSELSTVIARLVWTYELKPADGPDGQTGQGKPQARAGRKDPGEFQVYDRITTTVEGPMIQLRPRRRAEWMV